jgi:hypothetical protein
MAGTGAAYTFTDNWAPRVGVSVDPFGDRKSKIYGNYGRYNYQTPLDAAVRSLSGEKDLTKMVFNPEADGSGNLLFNANGTINVPVDAAHLLNGAANSGGVPAPSISASPFGTAFAPGSKMMYQDEYLVGAEHEFKGGLVISGRFIYRIMPRALDDVAGVSPEGLNQNPNFTQFYFIANPGPKTDLFPKELEHSIIGGSPACNDPAVNFSVAQVQDANGGTINPATGQPSNNGNGVCWTKVNGFWGGEIDPVTGAAIPDGIPDGFPQIVHTYKAVEIEANKAFSHNWMLRANWRIASLHGNYEGAFRNDNGQTDPNISSLFDFTNGIVGMLGDQYKPGPLNTDRRHIVNIYTSYVFPRSFLKGLELGGGVNILSGTPISRFANHPAYANSGEVPLGERGIDGRTAISGGVNLHVEKPFRVTERFTAHLTADLFNITNSRVVTNVDQNLQISGSALNNPDFGKPDFWTDFGPGPGPIGYQRPFYARFAFRMSF